jgi:hypothetical protein
MTTNTWQVTGKGYLKSPNLKAEECELLLQLRNVGTRTLTLILSENRDFGWDALAEHPDNYEGTRGEALIEIDYDQLKALAEAILRLAPFKAS